LGGDELPGAADADPAPTAQDRRASHPGQHARRRAGGRHEPAQLGQAVGGEEVLEEDPGTVVADADVIAPQEPGCPHCVHGQGQGAEVGRASQGAAEGMVGVAALEEAIRWQGVEGSAEAVVVVNLPP